MYKRQGSCSEEIVDTVKAHCKYFYIRANRCSAFYEDMFALRGWKAEEINGIRFELNSNVVEKWKGKPYRLVIQRQRDVYKRQPQRSEDDFLLANQPLKGAALRNQPGKGLYLQVRN